MDCDGLIWIRHHQQVTFRNVGEGELLDPRLESLMTFEEGEVAVLVNGFAL